MTAPMTSREELAFHLVEAAAMPNVNSRFVNARGLMRQAAEELRSGPAQAVPPSEPVAWIAHHPVIGYNHNIFALDQNEAVARLMRTDIAGLHGWSVEPLYAALPSGSQADADGMREMACAIAHDLVVGAISKVEGANRIIALASPPSAMLGVREALETMRAALQNIADGDVDDVSAFAKRALNVLSSVSSTQEGGK